MSGGTMKPGVVEDVAAFLYVQVTHEEVEAIFGDDSEARAVVERQLKDAFHDELMNLPQFLVVEGIYPRTKGHTDGTD